MKIEKLSNNKSVGKGILIGFVVCLIFVILVSLLTSKAKYQNSETVKIVEGKVNYILPDLNVVAAYQKDDQGTYQKIEDIPQSGYKLNKNDSYCTIPNDAKHINNILEFVDGKLTVNINKKGTKCYLYFEKKVIKNAQELLDDVKTKYKGYKDTFTEAATTNEGIYNVSDGMYGGASYYWRGAVEDNYVHFANFYWRIIRINGDGTLRLIYDGDQAYANGDGPHGTNRQIGTIAYNTSYGDNMYVGFRYESSKKQGSKDPSTILGADSNPASGTLNKWYEDNIKGKPAENHIDKNAIFCNDRRSSSTTTTFSGRDNKGGTSTTPTYYGAHLRILPNGSWGAQQTADLSCEEADRFSAKGATKGNKSLTYPVGLITADEVVFAGGWYGSENKKYYLYTGQYFWTMSPSYFSGSGAYVFYVDNYGYLNYYTYGGVDWTVPGVRPVINLKADTTFVEGGLGTKDKPYEVS